MILRSESGNVVIETVIGILIFAGAIFPAATTLSNLATRQSELSEAVMAIGRGWSVVDESANLQQIQLLAQWFKKEHGIEISLQCPGVCSESSLNLTVKGRVQTGFWAVGTLSESHDFVRDVYAE